MTPNLSSTYGLAMGVAQGRGHTKYSELAHKDTNPDVNPTVIEKFLAAAGTTDFPKKAARVAADPTMRWVYVTEEYTFDIFHSGIVDKATNPTKPSIVGIITDNLGSDALGTIPDRHVCLKTVFGLAPPDALETAGFPVFEKIKADELLKKGCAKDDERPNTIPELGFGGAGDDEDGDAPAVTLVPLLLPVPPGAFIPVGATVTETLPAPPQGTMYNTTFQVWSDIMKHLITHNNGQSLTSSTNDKLFAPGQFQPVDHGYTNDNIVHGPVTVVITPVLASSRIHKANSAKVMARVDLLLTAWYNQAGATRDELSIVLGLKQGPSRTLQDDDPEPRNSKADQIDMIARTVAATMRSFQEAPNTSKEKSEKDDQETAIGMLRILLGNVGYDPERGNNKQVLPGDLHPQVIKAIKEPNKTKRAKLFREHINDSINAKTNADNPMYYGVSLLKEQIDTPLTNALFASEVFCGNLITDASSITTQVTIFNFLPVTKDNPAFLKRMNADATMLAEHRAGEDATKRATKTTTLFIHGDQKSAHDIVTCGYNLLAFLESISDGPPTNSSLYRALKTYIGQLHKREGKAWASQRQKKYPHMGHTLGLDMQDIFSVFVSVATNKIYIEALRNGEEIEASAWEAAETEAIFVQQKLSNAMHRSQDVFLQSVPDTYSLFFGQTSDTPKRKNEGTISDHGGKHQRTDQGPSRDRRDVEPLKKKGLLLVNGTYPQDSSMTFPMPNGRPGNPNAVKARLCRNFVSRGSYCSRGSNCTFVHLAKLSDLSRANQEKVTNWVNRESTITFAPGQGPSSTALAPPSLQFMTPLEQLQLSLFKQRYNQQPSPSPTISKTNQANFPTLDHPPRTTNNEPTEEDYELAEIPEADELPAVSSYLPGQPDPVRALTPPRILSRKDREKFVATLDEPVRRALDSPHGKPHPMISFVSERVFRHIIPPLHKSGFLVASSLEALRAASPLVVQYEILAEEFESVDTTPARGYDSYEHATTESSINSHRVKLASAALFQQGFSVPKTVRYLGGPHLAEHRNVKQILATLRPSVEPSVLAEIQRIFTYGAPTKCNASATDSNLKKFFYYGNHKSARDHPELLMNTFIKDAKKGATLVVDKRMLPFTIDLHLVPMGMVDIDNKWRKVRPISDSTFHPTVDAMNINDWTSKHNEPSVIFPSALDRYLIWNWNLRISYPNGKILAADNDVSGAFRIVKYNPWMVSMHGYVVGDYLGFSTGMTFGDNTSPGNFEPIAIARQQHATWLWQHKPQEVLTKASQFVEQMIIPTELTAEELPTVAQANKDSLNQGVFNPDGSRQAPPFPHYVDDCFFSDTREYIARTASASIVSLFDVCGADHPYQESVLSLEKLDLAYTETRLIVGHLINTRRMVVAISPRRREKVTSTIQDDNWIHPREQKHATIRELATLLGILQVATKYFNWGKIQILRLHQPLRDAVRTRYRIAQRSLALKNKIASIDRALPKELAARFQPLCCQAAATYIWNRNHLVPIPKDCTNCLRLVYDYLISNKPWETPIGHLVPRDPAVKAVSDASAEAIGVLIPDLKVWCLLPLGPETWAKFRRAKNINPLEFIGIILAYIMTLLKVEEAPNKFPPAPLLHTECDNKTSISWCTKMSTESSDGQNLLHLFAEYLLLSPLGLTSTHIAGVSASTKTKVLEYFPAECRPYIETTIDAVLRCEQGTPKSASEQRRIRSLRIHFVWFTKEFRMYNQLFPLVNMSTEGLNYLMACYAAHLWTGNTLSHHTIRSTTIAKYLHSAASFLMIFDSDPSGRDARKARGMTTMCHPVNKVLQEAKRWEDVPDRREPYTVAMQIALIALALTENFLGLTSALCDWFCVMTHAGGRRMEWAQGRGRRKMNQFEKNLRGAPAAFCLKDVVFLNRRKQRLTHDEAIANPSSAALVEVCWRMQKNGDHGEKKIFSRNIKNPQLDAVDAWIRIVRRFRTIVGERYDIPLAIYRCGVSARPQFITTNDIENMIRRLACQVYRLDPVKDKAEVSRFSAHSLRVGACCILQAAGFAPHEIQKLLRWKSETWKIYTRNLVIVAKKHSDAIADAANLPCL